MRPHSIEFAVGCVVVAVAAGALETLLRAPTLTNLGIRTIVYSIVLGLAWLACQGHSGARKVLAVGLGTVGLASLLMEPLAAILSANDDLLARIDPMLASIRLVHIGAVIAAVVAFFRADARAYVRPRALRRR